MGEVRWLLEPDNAYNIIKHMAPLVGIGPSNEFAKKMESKSVYLVSQPGRSETKPPKETRPLSEIERAISELLRSSVKPRG